MRPQCAVAVLILSVSACKCGPQVAKVNPSLLVSPAGLDFSKVKVGAQKQLTVRLEAQTSSAVILNSIAIEGGGASAYRLGSTPTRLESLGSASFTVTFAPGEVAALTASLVISSNDPERPIIRIALAGEGALPSIEVTPDCLPSRGCTGSIVVDPPSIDFGMEPLIRLMPIETTKLPTLVIVNSGAVALEVRSVMLRGADAAAFTIAGGMPFPAGGLSLEAAAGFNLPLRFIPTSEMQRSYSAELVITSDDPIRSSVTVSLRGSLRPNQPPTVCANLIRVVPQAIGDAPRDYGSPAHWAPLLTPPPQGYDFSTNRDARPDELVVFSATSDSAVATACSADPEDGRAGLTYRWRLTATPPGGEGLALSGAASPQVQLRPVITGQYALELTVTDSRMSSASVEMRFAVAIKQDLVAQLQWVGFPGVDLDIHLIRPSAVVGADPFSGAFAFFNAGVSARTSGDLNGYSKLKRDRNPGSAFDFDWGLPGASDDPVLNVDDIGSGSLLENVSLNYPENDPLCAASSCTYRVMVHYFDDRRGLLTAPACEVDGGPGCSDGEQCSCAASSRCVAEAAPAGSMALGSGKCFPAPKPVARLFFRGSPTAAATIPLPMNDFLLGAPCKLWHAADITWPAKIVDGGIPGVTVIGADGGVVISPSVARFGLRKVGGSLKCEPDSTQNSVDWYSRQP